MSIVEKQIPRTFDEFLSHLENNYSHLMSIIYMVVGSGLYPATGAISKYLHNISGPQLIYFRVIVFLILNTYIINRSKSECYFFQGPKTKFLIITRGIMGCITSISFYTSVKYIAISETAIIYQGLTIWTAITAICFLKTQRGTFRLFLSILISFSGLILVARPKFIFKHFLKEQDSETISQERVIGVSFAFLSSFSAAYVYVVTSQLKQYVNSQVLVQYFAIVTAFLTSLYLLIWGHSIAPTINEALYLLAFGSLSLLSQSLIAKALQLGQPVHLSIIGYCEVIIGYIIDIAIFHTQIEIFSVLGTFMIIGGLLIVISERQQTR